MTSSPTLREVLSYGWRSLRWVVGLIVRPWRAATPPPEPPSPPSPRPGDLGAKYLEAMTAPTNLTPDDEAKLLKLLRRRPPDPPRTP